MAYAYAAQGEDSKAEACFKEAPRLYKVVLEDSCQAQIADLLNQMGLFYPDRKMLNEAIECLKEALRTKKRLFGNDDPTVAKIAGWIADVLVLDGAALYDAALKCYAEAERIYDIGGSDAIEGSTQPLKSASIVSKRGDMYNKQGDKEKVVELYIDSLRIYKSTIGEDSIESFALYHELGNINHEVEE